MTLSDEVLNDLLTLYLAGEASPATRRLIENHAREHPAFRSRLEAAAAVSLDAIAHDGPSGDLELLTLRKARQFLFLRAIFWAGGVLFTLLPFLFTFGDGGVRFLVLGRHPGLVWSFWSLAAACWTASFVMQRQVRQSGL